MSDFLIRMRISSKTQEIDLALNFGKIGRLHRENFHFSWKKVPNQIPCGSGSLTLSVNWCDASVNDSTVREVAMQSHKSPFNAKNAG